MQVFNNFFEILLAPTEPKNLILLNFPKKAYHAHPPPPPHSEGYSPMILYMNSFYGFSWFLLELPRR